MELTSKQRQLIKTQATSEIGLGGFTELFSLSLYISTLTEYTPEERRVLIAYAQKAYYINKILIWKIWALIGERRWMQAEFKELCQKWEALENLINLYNAVVPEAGAKNEAAIKSIKEAAADFAPITIFKSGKIQLQNRAVQRLFQKMRNRHTQRINFHFLIAETLTNFIEENGLNDFIEEDINKFIDELYKDLAHAPKYSREEFNKSSLIHPPKNAEESKAQKEAEKYAVYPPRPNCITANNTDQNLAEYFLFDDLKAAIRWTTTI